jgi:hypothetical protein
MGYRRPTGVPFREVVTRPDPKDFQLEGEACQEDVALSSGRGRSHGGGSRMSSRPDDFSDGVKRILAHRVGFRCSGPSCRALTVGPAIAQSNESMSIGVAAHITAATPGGPRYNPKLSSDQRRSVENGLWLCQNHAREIDTDLAYYTVDLLRTWKHDAEETARALFGRPVSAQALDVVIGLVAHRDSDNGLLLMGATNLPDGTRLMADLHQSGNASLLGQAHTIVLSGTFIAGPFTDDGHPHPHGWYAVRVVSYFNDAWQQQPAVLSLVGSGGCNLAGRFAEPTDADVDDPEFRVLATFECVAPPLRGGPPPSSDEISQAVEIVRNAVLTVDGRRSASPIHEVIDRFLGSPGLRVRDGWSCDRQANGLIRVVYSSWDGAHPRLAEWVVLLDTREVRYRNRMAKWFSWLPED